MPKIVEEIEREIRRLKLRQESQDSTETARTQLAVPRHNVADARGLDRLRRSEVSLERNFDRPSSQPEHLERGCPGQTVLCKPEVHAFLS
jgi:hypothetical protein